MKLDIKRKTLTASNVDHLAYLATLVAVEAPARESKWASAARIPWSLVKEIRAALDAIGFDWETAAKNRFKAEQQQRIDDAEARYPSRLSAET